MKRRVNEHVIEFCKFTVVWDWDGDKDGDWRDVAGTETCITGTGWELGQILRALNAH